MYVILVYDVDVSRVNKINKFLKRYLLWIQNSVFEGEISESLYEKMKKGIDKIIKENDSVIIYKFKTISVIDREIIGMDKGKLDNVI
ncbi:MAG: CRISPR-associated endonuclease Cas2 [Thermoplasmata archaeon]